MKKNERFITQRFRVLMPPLSSEMWIIITIEQTEEMRITNSHATTSCKSTWDTVPYFGVNGLSMILCLWSPLHPLSKLLAIQDHTQNLEEQLWMGGRREVSVIFYRPVTRSDLKQERSFFRGSVSSYLQLVVARLMYVIPGWNSPPQNTEPTLQSEPTRMSMPN